MNNVLKLAVLIALTRPSPVPAQQAVQVKGSATGCLEEHRSQVDLVAHLTEEARVDALAKAFGTGLLSAEVLEERFTVKNQQESVVTGVHRHLESGVRGVWICDRQKPQVKRLENGTEAPCFTVDVQGWAKPHSNDEVPLQTRVGRCPEAGCSTRIFSDGDPLFLHFEAAADGWLMSYLEDPYTDSVYAIHPNRDRSSAMPVQGNEAVVIPDPTDQNYYYNLALFAGEEEGTSRQWIWLVYSEKEMQGPVMDEFPEEPARMTRSDWQHWLRTNLVRQEGLQTEVIPISVQPKSK